MAHKEHRTSFRLKLFNRFSHNKTSVETGAVLTGTSAFVAGASQSNNSAAASKNLHAASVKLHDYLETLEDNAYDSMPPDVVSMSRWIEKTEKFSNSSYGDGSTLNVAELPRSHRSLIDLAAVNSKTVYGVSASSLGLRKPGNFDSIGPAIDLPPDALIGTLKATSIRFFKSDLNGDGNLTPIIVIAIRGTASIRDWSVNFNNSDISSSSSSSSSPVVNMDFLGHVDGQRAYTVHAGFLESARQTVSPLHNALSKLFLHPSISQSPQRPQLLLTGHSAGGAVASILYAHLTRRVPKTQTQPHLNAPSALQTLAQNFSAIHLVTFGAPPVTNPPITQHSPGARNNTAFYAIVNEGDPIPRADEKYIDALLRIYVSPVSAIQTVPSLSSQLGTLNLGQSQSQSQGERGPRCDLPTLLLKNAGWLLLIRKGRFLDDPVFYYVPEEGEGALEKMLFGNPGMHRMVKYLERLTLVESERLV